MILIDRDVEPSVYSQALSMILIDRDVEPSVYSQALSMILIDRDVALNFSPKHFQ